MHLVVRRTLLASALGVAVLGGAGLLVAAKQSPFCIVALAEDLEARGIMAPDSFGTTEVSARVMPFVVDVGIKLPRQQHAIQCSARYIALPWGVFQITHDETRNQ